MAGGDGYEPWGAGGGGSTEAGRSGGHLPGFGDQGSDAQAQPPFAASGSPGSGSPGSGSPGSGFGAPGQNPAGVPGAPQNPPMTSFPPAETGFFPAAGFQAPPGHGAEQHPLLDAPAEAGRPKRRRGLLIGASAIAVVGVTAGVIVLAGGGDGKGQPVAAASSPSTSAAPVDDSAAGSSTADRGGEILPGGSGSTAPPSAGSKAPSSAGWKAPPPAGSKAPPVVPPPADRLHWRLSEAAGSAAADSSGHGLTGTASGAAAFAPGQHGGAVLFNGPAGQIKGGEVATKAPAIDTTKSFTVSMWIDQTGLTTPTKYAAAFSQDGPQCFAFTFSYSTEAKTWSFVRANEDSTTPTSIAVGAKSPTPP